MKNLINFMTFLILVVSISASSCNNLEKRNRHIYVKNNSSKSIYYGLSYSYPDTSLAKIDDAPGNNGSIAYKINSGEQTTFPAANFVYNPTMQLFILDAAIVETNPWDSIVVHYNILKRYQFTEQYIQSLDWTIIYP